MRTIEKTPVRIRILLARKNLGQKSLAKKCRCSSRFLGLLFQGERGSKKIIPRAADALGVTPDHLKRLIREGNGGAK